MLDIGDHQLQNHNNIYQEGNNYENPHFIQNHNDEEILNNEEHQNMINVENNNEIREATEEDN